METAGNEAPGRPFPRMIVGVVLLVIGALGGWLAHRTLTGAGVAENDRAAVQMVVRNYLLDHPEILPAAMERLRAKENRAQLAGIRGDVEKPFPGAVLGNPNGKTTLVEFTDYACGYCRRSVDDVEALIAERPDLRVVMRELPILSPESADAARWALAAAEQGKYAAFHRALFTSGRLSADTIAAASRSAGLDLARAKATIAQPGVDAELGRNVAFAHQLGFQGTPSWIAGDNIFSGAIGKAVLAKAIGASS
jgi:protein-disulfide isomerase